MVQLDQEVIVIALPVYVQLLGRQSEIGLELIDQIEIVENDGVVIRVFVAALSFIIAEEEGAVFPDRAAQGETELVLLQLVQAGSRQFTASVYCIVAEILIQRPMQVIGPALGNDVDDSAHRGS